jgi:hypothetical protein
MRQAEPLQTAEGLAAELEGVVAVIATRQRKLAAAEAGALAAEAEAEALAQVKASAQLNDAVLLVLIAVGLAALARLGANHRAGRSVAPERQRSKLAQQSLNALPAVRV